MSDEINNLKQLLNAYKLTFTDAFFLVIILMSQINILNELD